MRELPDQVFFSVAGDWRAPFIVDPTPSQGFPSRSRAPPANEPNYFHLQKM
jgi:hypothetical protein